MNWSPASAASALPDAGLKSIPAVVRSLTDEESLTVALIENIQREDLNPIEAARAYKQLMDHYGLTQTQLGEQIGKKQSTISNGMRLLTLPLEMQESISEGLLTEAHGKALLSVSDPQKQREVWQDPWRCNECQGDTGAGRSGERPVSRKCSQVPPHSPTAGTGHSLA